MSWFWAAYLTIAALAFLPRLLLLDDPVFLFAAPVKVWRVRLFAILSPWEPFPLRVRALLLFRWCLLLFDQGFWHLLWTVDDIFFPAYRDIDLKGSVFIVGEWRCHPVSSTRAPHGLSAPLHRSGGFRTGSTSLHRTLALDHKRFASPRMLEIVYPFLSIHYLLDFLEKVDKKYGTKFIDGVDQFFKNVCGEEILAR
jgi:hypothetical protein